MNMMTPELVEIQWGLNHLADGGKKHTWRDFIRLDANHFFDVYYDEGDATRPDS